MIEFAPVEDDAGLEAWTQRDNQAMRRLNARLGYMERSVSIAVRARLPLP